MAASRRKDRSLDARLESANRASMLHKKRTGKGLHITREIVEKEAMYEEIDERYQEKRLKLLRTQATELEEQFQRHLIATMGCNQSARVSAHGGVQKTRHSSIASAHSYFPDMSQQQTMAPLSPGPSPTSPVFDMTGGGASSPTESSYVQTPGSGCYGPSPVACPPSYVDPNTGLMTPSISPRNSTSHQHVSQIQSLHLRSASIAQPTPTVSYPAPSVRGRYASFPDAFMFQRPPPQLVAQVQPQPQPQPQQLSATTATTTTTTTPSPVSATAMTAASSLQNNVFPSPALSASSMTNNSTQSSNSDDFLSQAQAQVQEAQQLVVTADFKLPLLGGDFDETPDPEYHEFFNFASTMEDNQWQIPMGSTPYDEFMNLDSLESEF